MNCYQHVEVPATAFCRSCGKAMCIACQRPANGTVYCEEHYPLVASGTQNPYTQPMGAPAARPVSPIRTSPGLAFALGFIPGVGAIYNGQYLKGLVHAIIFGVLISLLNSAPGPGAPILAILLTAFVFYMPFEAFHTAKRRSLGVPVEEFSSLISQNRFGSRTPLGPVFLIGIGVLFLLDTLNLVQFRDLARFWPVLLIVVGAFMLYNRMAGASHAIGVAPPPYRDPISQEPVTHEFLEPRQ